MWGLLSGYIDYIKIGFVILVVCGSFYGGFHLGNNRYLEYKASVEAIARTQEAKIASIEAQHELVTKGIQDEYDAKLALIRQYYSNGVRSNGTSAMPGISSTSSLADATATYAVFARQCAETTLQLVELQKWMLEQVGIK
jgi:hypothetical protein